MRAVATQFRRLAFLVGGCLFFAVAADPLGVGIFAAQAAPPSQATIHSDKPAATDTARVTSGLVAFYDFRETDGPVVKDQAAVVEGLDLRIREPRDVRRQPGSLEVVQATRIESPGPASRLVERLRRSNQLTIEVWIRPARRDQQGPARIVTLSKNPSERNFTLGQDGAAVDARLRTTATSHNGIPSLGSGSAALPPRVTHVVYTRSRDGRSRIFIDGEPRADKRVAGNFSNWDLSQRVALANEMSGDRPWLGTYYLVAIYERALGEAEVARNFQAGPEGTGTPNVATAGRAGQARLFEQRVAPILALHCLECHDVAARKGGLDLSRKAAALAGGESGRVIEPGQPNASRLWQVVVDDEMPPDRLPLSKEDKETLKQWIEQGADWTVEFIDPAIYAHDQRAAELWIRRLTQPEYIATVRAAVGVDIEREARELLPADLRADGFRNTAYNLQVDLKHVRAYAELARIIVERMEVNRFAARFSRSRRLTDDNMRKLVADMGKWLLRGPLDEREIVSYRGISTAVAAAGGDFELAVRYTIEAMLQSPRFIYRVENQRGDGTAWPVSDYELASRLSYILWGGPPDEALMDAAERGQLSDRRVVEQHVRRMLGDPRAVEQSKRFASQWLNLDRLENLRPDPDRFPAWEPTLAEDMRRETLAFFEDVVWKQQRPLSDLLHAQVTHATERLARHYNLPSTAAERGGPPDALHRYDLASVPGRGGLLTHGSVLTIGGDEASMVSRGLFVLHDLLRGTVKDPPPCVDTTPVPTRAGLTQRGIAEARIANEACGGCHARFEPLAFGLERFDGLGTYREKDEHGNTLRQDGKILFPGQAEAVPYRTSSELMKLLAESPRVRETLTWKVAQFALGRPLTAADAPALRQIHQSARERGGTYAAVMTEIVLSDLVQKSRTEKFREGSQENTESRTEKVR